MLTFKLNNIDREFERIRRQFSKEFITKFNAKLLLLERDLINATPIDTGLARESWLIEFDSNKKATIRNTAPYIEILNQGYSKQAPAHFIERIALKYGEPKGVILNEIK